MNSHLKLISELIVHIENNLAEEVNVLDLARQVGLSPWHFQRLFKSLIGDSLGAYLRGRRLTKGAQLLLETNHSIIQIAVSVGFGSHESFTRSFKSFFKLSPKQFRLSRPSFSLYEKPVLTPELIHHITQGMSLSPTFMTLPEQRIVGLSTEVTSPFTTIEPICNMVGETWFKLFERQAQNPILCSDEMVALTISPSGTFTEDLLQYLAGVPVSTEATLSPDMSEYLLPERHVAVFETQTNVDAEVAKRTIDYVYGFWFANQSVQRGNGIDYEWFVDIDDAMAGKFKSRYVVPLQN
ncbi:AraC family transcriptional regulator [Reinekea sp. G2M2-21]|uniref:helix-turn-helix domain-containing protein n=1 Tax=Reinekea sp. G2M2-21 TaxID=2788942 RepID=UPI0018AB637C